MDSKIKIIIVDDHAMFREGIRILIEMEGMGEVVAEAENGQIFIDLLEEYTPDLVLMDIEMPVLNGLEAIKRAKALIPEIKFLVLTMLSEKENYTSMINAGAIGFVLKTSGKKELEKAIRTVASGESYLSNELLYEIIINSGKQHENDISAKNIKSTFTERELEILNLLCKGFSTSEIADKIFRSIKTVESHRSNLLEKTNSKNTINLILFALKNKLVDL